MSCFQFKQFVVGQQNSAMKVNTDGVLLGAWMSLFPSDASLLDVGTGCGVIALMAAQRLAGMRGGMNAETKAINNTVCRITALEIDKGSCVDAANNFEAAPWSEKDGFKIEARLCSFQEFAQTERCKYNLIFSNPPYFINSLKAPEASRSNARHTDSLSQREMIQSAVSLLGSGGRLALVLPAVEAELFLKKTLFLLRNAAAGEQVLQLSRLCKVHTTENKPAKRWLMEFVLKEASCSLCAEQSRLVIQQGGDYTLEYKALTGAFYLHF